ncbi:hypothetical protein PHMEG_00030634 [Phytophthora megakarya]|uniref:MULE transposase domain-containing protein n=1 Tax=Phytophthora megakarya TaxID=4795 RepID=A0A225V0L0_9STRA|nr:hypothetical protein PHMEG_00030634 [Phytophthora megakarya]
MMESPKEFSLHIDATYKLNRLDYSTIVIDISDQSRGFHLVSLFVVSQETQTSFEAALFALRRLYEFITGTLLEVQYAMKDPDQAQHHPLHGFKAYLAYLSFQIVKVLSDLHFSRPESLVE